MRWRTKAGDEIAARLGELLTKDSMAQAWRTALDPKGEWIPSVLAAADKRLTEVRRGVPDAGGLVIASNQTAARAYATDPRGHHRREADARALRRRGLVGADRGVRRERVALDGGRAHGVRGRRRAAAVRRRLRHLDVDAAVLRPGRRPVRARAAPRRDGLGVPAVGARHPRARGPAGGRARPRARPGDQGRQRRVDVGRGGRPRSTRPTAPPAPPTSTRWRSRRWSPTPSSTTCCSTPSSSASTPSPGRTRSRSTSGCPGCSSRTRWRSCCTSGRPPRARRRPRKVEQPVSAHRALAAQRQELNKLVAAYARKKGTPHGVVHNELRRACGGPALDEATSEQVVGAGREDPGLVRRPPLTPPAPGDRTGPAQVAAAEGAPRRSRRRGHAWRTGRTLAVAVRRRLVCFPTCLAGPFAAPRGRT